MFTNVPFQNISPKLTEIFFLWHTAQLPYLPVHLQFPLVLGGAQKTLENSEIWASHTEASSLFWCRPEDSSVHATWQLFVNCDKWSAQALQQTAAECSADHHGRQVDETVGRVCTRCPKCKACSTGSHSSCQESGSTKFSGEQGSWKFYIHKLQVFLPICQWHAFLMA